MEEDVDSTSSFLSYSQGASARRKSARANRFSFAGRLCCTKKHHISQILSAIYGVIYLLRLSLSRNGLSLYAEVLGIVESKDAFADHWEEEEADGESCSLAESLSQLVCCNSHSNEVYDRDEKKQAVEAVAP